MKLLAIAAAAALSSLPSAAAAQAHGKIRICREAGLTELMDRHSVPIPAGTAFVNASDRNGNDLKPHFEAHTTAPVVLPPKPGCVTAPAVLDDNPEHFALTKRYPPMPSQLNVAGLSVLGRVAEDFR